MACYEFSVNPFDETLLAEPQRISEVRYRTLIDSLGEGIALVNLNEQFTMVNPAAENIFGVPPGGLLGRSLSDFTSSAQFDRMRGQTGKREEFAVAFLLIERL